MPLRTVLCRGKVRRSGIQLLKLGVNNVKRKLKGSGSEDLTPGHYNRIPQAFTTSLESAPSHVCNCEFAWINASDCAKDKLFAPAKLKAMFNCDMSAR